MARLIPQVGQGICVSCLKTQPNWYINNANAKTKLRKKIRIKVSLILFLNTAHYELKPP